MRAISLVSKALLLLLMGLGLAPALAQSEELTLEWVQRGASPHFVYFLPQHYRDTPQDMTSKQIGTALECLEKTHALLTQIWGDNLAGKTEYFKLASRQEMGQVTGFLAQGLAIPSRSAIYSIHACHVHEVAHLLTLPDGFAALNTFWIEGIAMYFTWPSLTCDSEIPTPDCPYRDAIGFYEGHSVHFWAQKFYRDRSLPALSLLINGDPLFHQLDGQHSYPVAGSFIAFLLDQLRVEPRQFRQFLEQASRANSNAGVLDAFRLLLGRNLGSVEVEWHEFLETWDEGRLRAVPTHTPYGGFCRTERTTPLYRPL
ncbi:MAG: hypothetical protein SFU83_24405 [Meiothermus sp.]|nr:hypothetical protein [Meiothermus sp.]